MLEQPTAPRIVATDSHRTIEGPSETQLHDLLADINLSVPFVIVERLDDDPGDHYLQVRLDERVDPNQGRAYLVEFRDGGPEAHFRAVVSDNSPWDSAFSPAFDTVVSTVQSWAFQREDWRTALAWERLEFEN
ncbi:hypothetical protein [Amycolatopsis rhizosphaerae]|uniref:hypothetical protein n=1 Tax=Amycolatopsis rhizosphaerae TaxID=2053003 RepID=UPI001FEBCF7E|nr:hypothetical protein [Amycolatopsis rhizosphaerae]